MGKCISILTSACICFGAIFAIPSTSWGDMRVSAVAEEHQQSRTTDVQLVKWSKATASTSLSCLPGNVKVMLNSLTRKFGTLSIVSTYRKNALIAGTRKRSYHASCRAVDFHPPRNKYKQVLAYLRSTWKGGLGTYSGCMHHLHIDNGPRVRFHHRVGRCK